jgi:hypothetical protein
MALNLQLKPAQLILVDGLKARETFHRPLPVSSYLTRKPLQPVGPVDQVQVAHPFKGTFVFSPFAASDAH